MQDMAIICLSSLGRSFHFKRSTTGRASAGSDGLQRGQFAGNRRRDVDAENRLIDQLDEEWDD
jgi:cation-dependent mannose-6-phosphate receptor